MHIDTKTNVARALLMLTGSHNAASLHDDLHAIISAAEDSDFAAALAVVHKQAAVAAAHPDEWVGIGFASPVQTAQRAAAHFLTAGGINLYDVGGIVAGSQERHVVVAALRTLALQAEEAA